MRSRAVSLLVLIFWMGGLGLALTLATRERPIPGPPFPTKEIPWSDFVSAYIVPTLPINDELDAPVRPPDGSGAVVTLPFLEGGHLGEDWAVSKGDGSLGEPIYSLGDGWVSLAHDYENAWGKTAFVIYRFPDGRWPPYVEVLFAQLATLKAKTGDHVKRGQQIGTIGNAGGIYLAHLHWEVRQIAGLGLGAAFSERRDGWLEPSDTLRAHRGDRAKIPLQLRVLKSSEREGWGSE